METVNLIFKLLSEAYGLDNIITWKEQQPKYYKALIKDAAEFIKDIEEAITVVYQENTTK